MHLMLDVLQWVATRLIDRDSLKIESDDDGYLAFILDNKLGLYVANTCLALEPWTLGIPLQSILSEIDETVWETIDRAIEAGSVASAMKIRSCYLGAKKKNLYLVLIAICHFFSLAGHTHSPRGAQCGEATRVAGANYILSMHT
ncbi:hypothetical protein B0H13DRAFT_1883129 [Mycena leptocephala]|nr:hypothetical protein B0H13DRAFT_1883129 [Mycena leptocephala]